MELRSGWPGTRPEIQARRATCDGSLAMETHSGWPRTCPDIQAMRPTCDAILNRAPRSGWSGLKPRPPPARQKAVPRTPPHALLPAALQQRRPKGKILSWRGVSLRAPLANLRWARIASGPPPRVALCCLCALRARVALCCPCAAHPCLILCCPRVLHSRVALAANVLFAPA